MSSQTQNRPARKRRWPTALSVGFDIAFVVIVLVALIASPLPAWWTLPIALVLLVVMAQHDIAELVVLSGTLALAFVYPDSPINGILTWLLAGYLLRVWGGLVARIPGAIRHLQARRTGMVIGLDGVAGSGKDTVGSILVDGADFTRISFADKLREFALAVDPFVPIYERNCSIEGCDTCVPLIVDFDRLSDYIAEVGWERAKRENPEVRELLQRLGTDAGRNLLYEDVWVDAVLRDLPAEGPVVFTDMRFPNEVATVQSLGGTTVRVERPGYEPVNGHVSERANAGTTYDVYLSNDGTKSDLVEKVRTQLLGM